MIFCRYQKGTLFLVIINNWGTLIFQLTQSRIMIQNAVVRFWYNLVINFADDALGTPVFDFGDVLYAHHYIYRNMTSFDDSVHCFNTYVRYFNLVLTLYIGA